MEIQGKNFLVTGGGNGMGRCFTRCLAELGGNVFFCDVNPDAISSVESDFGNLPGKVKGMVANVADEEQVRAFVHNGAETFGGLHGIINNAGIIRDGRLVGKNRKTGEIKALSTAKWQQVIDVNLTGVFLGTREFAQWYMENNCTEGVIVSISSISRHGNFGQSNYSAAKAGIVAMTALWSSELVRSGLRTGAVAPGFTRTSILDGMPPQALEAGVKAIPVGRIGEPEDIFKAIRFIIECDFFTGRCIDVDGGQRLA
ncbi:MAG: SDR family oxidoreductase [Myxococcota bacterium]|jgi:3-oxoacyl-[acyl-carrier protein] reductase|nr:SDR family oxidoreductase [Myxococcota bacterium]